MDSFIYEVRNLGNILYSKIDIKPLTLISGENNSGKTFITRSLYSFLSSFSNNHFRKFFIYKYWHIKEEISELNNKRKRKSTLDRKSFRKNQNIKSKVSNQNILKIIKDFLMH